MAGQKPVEKIKGGNNVSAAIWKNPIQVNGKTVTKYTVTLQKSYMKDGKWQNSASFDKATLPDAMFCMQKAFERLIELNNVDGDNEGVDEEVVM